MRQIAVNRLNIVAVPKGTGMSSKKQLIFLSELAQMGYRVSNPQLLDQASDQFFLDYHTLIQTLKTKRGGHVDYVPLFSGFPNQTPDDNAYFTKRIIGFMANSGLLTRGMNLDKGTKVPEWLFKLEEFGADPITQFQTKHLHKKGVAKQKKSEADSHVEWLDLELVFAEDLMERLKQWLQRNLYAGSSIKEALHQDLNTLLSYFDTHAVDFSRVVMKENRALLLSMAWRNSRWERVAAWAQTPTDLLRMFAALTDTDISLATTIRFPKFSRSQRRLVMRILESCSNPAEDLVAYRGLWLQVARSLHTGEYKNQFPKTYAAFQQLREGKIQTFNGRTEHLLKQGEMWALLNHLGSRPGLFGRKLHELLRNFQGDSDAVLLAFEDVAHSLTLKQLLVLERHMAVINDLENRAVINRKGKLMVIPNTTRGMLTQDTVEQVTQMLRDKQMEQLKQRGAEPWQSVWIDPQLENYTVPLQQRAASDGILTFGRGSRIPVDFDKVIRLFVYWKERGTRTDLDLSLMMLDSDFKYVNHVSYTNLKALGAVHSGDLQSAPHGAAEFIDITVAQIPSSVRFLAVQVYRYHGSAFADMDCHAGWMMREKVNQSYKSFDIKTVTNKFDLNGSGAYAFPIVVDLKNSETILTDLYMSGATCHNTLEGAYHNVSKATRTLHNFVETRPTMAQLANLHAEVHGAVHSDRESAGITFGVQGCTYNASDIETVLSELL